MYQSLFLKTIWKLDYMTKAGRPIDNPLTLNQTSEKVGLASDYSRHISSSFWKADQRLHYSSSIHYGICFLIHNRGRILSRLICWSYFHGKFVFEIGKTADREEGRMTAQGFKPPQVWSVERIFIQRSCCTNSLGIKKMRTILKRYPQSTAAD